MEYSPETVGIPRKIESAERIEFRTIEKNAENKKVVMELLHEYPEQFVHGSFEKFAEQDFGESDTMIAYDGNVPVGCLMFNKETSEFSWLAVTKNTNVRRREIGKKLFESFYPSIAPGTKVHLFINTEDAFIPGHPEFSGQNFSSARDMYKSMGLEMKEENRVENKYGEGCHVYRVTWIPTM